MSRFGNYPYHTFSDEVLVKMLQTNNELALQEIFERYHSRLFRLASAVLHDDYLAEDLVQDVFIDFWSRRHTSDVHLLSNYLHKAIKFQVLKKLRDGKVRDHHLNMIQNIQFANQTEEQLDFEELKFRLKQVLDELPPRCKEIFILSRFEQLSHKEISLRLNISTSTIEFQINKALSYLRHRLDKIIFLTILLLVF